MTAKPSSKLIATPESRIILPPKDVLWTPKLFGTQKKVFDCYDRYLLVCGSRLSGKTTAVLHRIARHLWETPGARVGFFAKSIKSAKDSGPWQDFMEIIIPEWVNSGIGFEVTTIDSTGDPGPKQDAQTRTSYIRFRNYFGGESEMRLFSVDHDHQVAVKVKSKSFSLMFFSELSMFKDARIFHQSHPSLRMRHLRENQHQWIGDTNPDEDLGVQSWFYKLWYQERLEKNHENPRFQKDLSLIELFLVDNPHATLKQIDGLRAQQRTDPALYDANFLGIHGDGAKQRKRLFSILYDSAKHKIGGKEGETDQITLRPTTTTLFGGWDIGSSINHCAIILEKWIRVINGKPRTAWSVLDEIVSVGEKLSLAEFTAEYLARQKALLEKYPGRTFEWMHWSDDSAVNVYRASSGSYDYLEIRAASNGKIDLHGVEKPKNSIRSRIRLLQMLLAEERVFISARCEKVIAMIQWARRGGTISRRWADEEDRRKNTEDEDEPFLRDDHKHVFDALTYPMYMESLDDMMEESNERPEAGQEEEESVEHVGV